MKKFVPISLICLLVPGLAFADDHEPVAPSEPAPAEAAPAEKVMPAPPPAAASAPAAPVEESGRILDNLTWMVMASGYYLFNSHRVSGPYNSVGYPYADSMGFGLAFAGANMQYMGDTFGVTIDLRYGSGAGGVLTAAQVAGSGGLSPLAPLKQGYVTWKAHDKLTLDLGWWDTIFGAEVVDEFENANYTRGALYFTRQPFNHMGLRATVDVSDKFGLTLFAANGPVGLAGLSGTVTDGDHVPSFGGQISSDITDDIFVAVGYMAGPNTTQVNRNWGHFIDAVGTWAVMDDLELIVNGDVTVDPAGYTGTPVLWGVSVAGIVTINDEWKVGIRGEYLDGNGAARTAGALASPLVTGTATLRYSPVENLILSVEPRAEWVANDAGIFRNRGGTGEDWYFGVLVGATAKIGN